MLATPAPDMIENQGPRLVKHAGSNGDRDWFRWQNDLRKIFFQGNHADYRAIDLDRRSPLVRTPVYQILSPLKRIEATGQKSS